MAFSILSKLGITPLLEMSEADVRTLVEADRTRRSRERALGRAKRMMKDSPRKAAPKTLESLGLAPAIIAKLRATGRPDSELVAEIQRRGLL
jgi:hypothetical protein